MSLSFVSTTWPRLLPNLPASLPLFCLSPLSIFSSSLLAEPSAAPRDHLSFLWVRHRIDEGCGKKDAGIPVRGKVPLDIKHTTAREQTRLFIYSDLNTTECLYTQDWHIRWSTWCLFTLRQSAYVVKGLLQFRNDLSEPQLGGLSAPGGRPPANGRNHSGSKVRDASKPGKQDNLC